MEWSCPWSCSSSRNFWPNAEQTFNLPVRKVDVTEAVQTGADTPHLEGLAILPLSSPLPEQRLLLVLLFLLLQRPDVLLETNEGVLLVHVCSEVNSVALD